MTRARLDSGFKQTGFLSAHQLGLISTSFHSPSILSLDLISPNSYSIFRFVYLLLIYLGRKWMASRPPFNLRTSLAAWSGALALFSILGFLRNNSAEFCTSLTLNCRTAPELLHILSSKGLRGSVCDPAFLETNKVCDSGIPSFDTWYQMKVQYKDE